MRGRIPNVAVSDDSVGLRCARRRRGGWLPSEPVGAHHRTGGTSTPCSESPSRRRRTGSRRRSSSNLPPRSLRVRIPPTVGVRAHKGDKWSMLTVGSDSVDALAGHLVALGVPFEVLEPPELVERMGRLADDLERVRRRRG